MLGRADHKLQNEWPENVIDDARPDDFAPTRNEIWCKNCKRKDHHFLAIRGRGKRLFYRILTLGTIVFYGFYRCRCCGTRRVGSIDLFRGPDRPNIVRTPVSSSDRDDFRREQRKLRISRFFRAINPFRLFQRDDDGWDRDKRKHRVRQFFSKLAWWRKRDRTRKSRRRRH